MIFENNCKNVVSVKILDSNGREKELEIPVNEEISEDMAQYRDPFTVVATLSESEAQADGLTDDYKVTIYVGKDNKIAIQTGR